MRVDQPCGGTRREASGMGRPKVETSGFWSRVGRGSAVAWGAAAEEERGRSETRGASAAASRGAKALPVRQNQIETNTWKTFAPNLYSGSLPAGRKFGSSAGSSE